MALAIVAGALAIREARAPADGSMVRVSPAASAADEVFRVGFLPLVERAIADVSILVATGEARERNLLRIRGQQEAMLGSLAAADTWLDANPPPPVFMPATTAYHEGAATIRAAMDEAQAGFLRFDFDRVARATEMMSDGEAALRLAASQLADGDPAQLPSARILSFSATR